MWLGPPLDVALSSPLSPTGTLAGGLLPSTTLVDDLALVDAGPPHEAMAPPGLPVHLTPELADGLAVYILGFVALSVWDAVALPWLQDRGYLPRIPPTDGSLTRSERGAPWLTTLTADARPDPEVLLAQPPETVFYLGRRGDVAQFLTRAPPAHPQPGEYEASEDWSAHYGVEVYLTKRRCK